MTGMSENHAHLLVVEGSGSGAGRTGGLASQLETLGFAVEVAASGRQALELAPARNFDLVLLHVDTPGADPVQVLGALQARDAGPRVPVIAVSKIDDLARLEQYLAQGADDFLVEPASPALLRARVSAALERSRLSARLSGHSDQAQRTAKQMEKLADDLTRVILPLGVALSAEKDNDRLVERILLESTAICNADAGTLYLRTEDDTLRFAMLHTRSLGLALGGTTGKEIPFPALSLHDPATGEPNLSNVATHVALRGESINIPDIYDTPSYDFSGTRAFDRQNNYRSISSLTVPLKNHEGQVIGVLQLLNAQDPDSGQVIPFNAYLQQVVESLASQAAVALSYQVLLDRQRKLTRIQRDMEIASQIQTDFLPSHLPQPEGWEIAARFFPAREVAGDFYDAFQLSRSHLFFLVADVCDKGVGAALFMALIRSLMRAFSEQAPLEGVGGGGRQAGALDSVANPKLAALIADLKVLNTVVLTNNYIIRNHMETNYFATMFCGVLEPSTGLLTYVNGGHNPPALVGRDGVKKRLDPTGPAVGMFPGVGFDLQQVIMEPGDTLLAFTDGVTEARGLSGEFFTEKRLLPLLKPPIASATALLDQIVASVRDHIGGADQYDDITMMAIQRKL